MQLVAPAGSQGALRAALDAGADAVYVGLQDATNARHFPGLNFSPGDLQAAVRLARGRGAEIYLAINTYPRAGEWARWQAAVDAAAEAGVTTLIAADVSVLEYASRTYPALNLHLSVQASATNWRALKLYREAFGINRAVLPRVLSLKQIERLASRDIVPLEVFGFGGLCIMAEGRCLLSSYACGLSPNNFGACSPAEAVEMNLREGHLETRLGGILIDRFSQNESAGYPTICKGRFRLGNSVEHTFESPTSLNTLALLPQLADLGIEAIKLEGRQRSPAYIAKTVGIWRAAIDALRADPAHYAPQESWHKTLQSLSEGRQTTYGAYARTWL